MMNPQVSIDHAGKVAIITGGGRGLGRAMALGLLSAGAHVVINDIDSDAIEETIEASRSMGSSGKAISASADVSSIESVLELVNKASKDLGALHILVNNAGVGPEIVRRDFMKNPIKLWEIEPDIWKRAIGINTLAPVFLASIAIPHMIRAQWGRVINITTSLDTMLRPGYAPYGGSKAATEAFTAILAGDLAGTGVTANVLIPGGAANTRLIPDDTPIDRFTLVQPEKMVAPLLWLTSKSANEVTGRRFVARMWDSNVPVTVASERAGAPIGWPGIERVQDRTDV